MLNWIVWNRTDYLYVAREETYLLDHSVLDYALRVKH